MISIDLSSLETVRDNVQYKLCVISIALSSLEDYVKTLESLPFKSTRDSEREREKINSKRTMFCTVHSKCKMNCTLKSKCTFRCRLKSKCPKQCKVHSKSTMQYRVRSK
jgi:hypothetical protein